MLPRKPRRSVDPLTLLIVMALGVIAISATAGAAHVTVTDGVTGRRIVVQNLMSADTLRWFFTDLPKTFTSFAPLGMVMLIMIGAGGAEQVGLIDAGLRTMLRRVPDRSPRKLASPRSASTTKALADAGDFNATVEYGEMLASMAGVFVDLREAPGHASLDPNPAAGYPAGNALAAFARANGHNGIIYPSVRHEGGICIVALWPNVVQSVVQGAMYRHVWSGSPAFSVEAL